MPFIAANWCKLLATLYPANTFRLSSRFARATSGQSLGRCIVATRLVAGSGSSRGRDLRVAMCAMTIAQDRTIALLACAGARSHIRTVLACALTIILVRSMKSLRLTRAKVALHSENFNRYWTIKHAETRLADHPSPDTDTSLTSR